MKARCLCVNRYRIKREILNQLSKYIFCLHIYVTVLVIYIDVRQCSANKKLLFILVQLRFVSGLCCSEAPVFYGNS